MTCKSMVFLVIATLMFCANVGMAQTEWDKYPSNPVLDLGLSGTWDDNALGSHPVLFDGMKYHMWYGGNDGSRTRVGYATSADGIGWRKYPGNPVLDLGPSGTWDDNGISNPSILFDDTEYHMWYLGSDGSKSRVGYATSADGIVWEKYSDNPVLDVGPSGTWDNNGIHYVPAVLLNGNNYQMWYAGHDGSRTRIGYATSIPGTGSISGHVTDMAGNSIQWALVIAIKTTIKVTTFTDENGDYEIPDLGPGIYWVLCVKRGYKRRIRKAEVVAGEVTTVDFMLTPNTK